MKKISNVFAPLKLLPMDNPVIADCPAIFVIVLFEILEAGAPIDDMDITVMLPVPPIQLVNMFPVTVLPGLEPVPSALTNPFKLVVPVTVIFEKLLFV